MTTVTPETAVLPFIPPIEGDESVVVTKQKRMRWKKRALAAERELLDRELEFADAREAYHFIRLSADEARAMHAATEARRERVIDALRAQLTMVSWGAILLAACLAVVALR